jgi:probable DNA repair protein
MIHVAGLVLKAMSGRLDYQEAGQLLRTPYLPGSARESAAKARLDRELREQPGSWVDVSDLLSRAQSHAPEFARRLACVTRSTPQRQRAADWANCFQSVLAQCGWPGDRTLGSDEHQAGIAWQKQLEALRGCDHIAGPMSRESALGLLQSLLSERIFQPEGNPQAVQVLGVMEALGQTFDALWICGLTSDDWPPATRPDPLLPVSLQRRLSLPDSSPPVARERAERRLRWLETSAPEVMISWPEFSGDEPLAPSPLVAHLPVSSPDHLRRWTVPTHRQALAAMASANATVTLADDPAPPVGSAVTLRGGARLLEHQARCPARAFLEYRLGAREMRVPSSGIDAATRGLLMHSVLEVLYQRVASHDQLRGLQPAEVRALLDEIIETEIRHAAPLRDATMRRLARQEHQRLLALIGQLLDIERNRPPFVVRTTEQALSSTTGPPAIARLGLRLKIDRIDELPDGRRLVIDYKTGQHLPVAKELWGARPRSPQLPLYATLTDAHGIAFIGVAASGVRWLGVGHGAWHIDGVVEAHELTKGGEPDWGSLRASWWKSLDRIARELLEGDFRIDRWRRDEAEGQWAMATRVHELPDADDEEPDA